MPVACPNCGSRYLRDARPQTIEEKAQKWRFRAPLRCLDCKTRFVSSTLIWSDLLFARCPHCYRMDLNAWSLKAHTSSFWTGLKVTLGANRWRCEYCRRNFASFRKRKEVFTFRRGEKRKAGRAQSSRLD